MQWERRAILVGLIAAIFGCGPSEGDEASVAGARLPAGQKDPAVDIVLGDTSEHYQEHGYQDFELGRSFDAMNDEEALDRISPQAPWVFLRSADIRAALRGGPERTFTFNERDALVSTVTTFEGGMADHLDRLVEVFGKTGKEPEIVTQRQPTFVRTDAFADYTFPRVLVCIQFADIQDVRFGDSQKTSVITLDRQWAEDVLHRDAAIKRKYLEWMEQAMEPVSKGDWAVDSAPKLPGLEPKAAKTSIAFYDKTRLQRMGSSIDDEDKQKRNMSCCCGYELEGIREVPTIYVRFDRLDETARSAPLKLGGDVRAIFRSEANFISGLQQGFLGRLTGEIEVVLAQEFFPPRTDKIRVLRNEGNPYAPTVREWETDHRTGRWTVRCLSDNRVVLSLTGQRGP